MSGFILDNNTGTITFNGTEYTESIVPAYTVGSQAGVDANTVKFNLLGDGSVVSTVLFSGGNNITLVQNGGNSISISGGAKNNFSGTTDPTTGDDSADGYSSGSIWINTSTPKAWICISAALGSADWNQIDATVSGGSSDHATLTNLSWTNSGHTGQSTAVPAWNSSGTAVTVQATSDEVMLVRRGGVLQWVPIVTGAILFSTLSGDIAASGVEDNTFEISAGTFNNF